MGQDSLIVSGQRIVPCDRAKGILTCAILVDKGLRHIVSLARLIPVAANRSASPSSEETLYRKGGKRTEKKLTCCH